MDFNKELQQVISKFLPEATANEMKKFIEEAENTKKQLQVVQEENATLTMEVVRLKSLEQRENELNKKGKELDAKELTLSETSRNLEIEILKVKLAAANESNGVVIRLVDKVFGHPSVTVTTSKNVAVPVDGGGNCAGFIGQGYETENTTSTSNKF